MPLTVEQFTQRLRSSGVLSDESCRDVLDSIAPGSVAALDGEDLARELVKQQRLTRFQAEQICAGKEKSLTLGNYVILDKLGQGGMGVVLKAFHRRMERVVALKVIAPKVVKDPVALKRFQREVVAAAKLTHSNIVAAYDADEAKGTHFLVMEYVEGTDLSNWIKRHGPMSVERAVHCIVQAARGLAYAHEKGVVHRDIKPHNLLLDSTGTVKVLDMGLARLEGNVGGSAEHADLTNSGAMMGTVDYMAPEQAMDSKHADARSDIYSLGCTLFYLLTGHATFVADTVMKRLTAHQNALPPSLPEEAIKASLTWHGATNAGTGSSSAQLAALNAVFQRMVAKLPSDRFQSMGEVIAALEQCRTEFGVDGDGATSSDIALQSFLRDIAGEGSSATKTAAAGSQTAVLPNDEATIVEPEFSRDTDATLHETIAREASTRTGTPKQSPRRIMVAGALAIALLLAVGFFAMRGPTGTLHLEVSDELTQVTVGETGRVVKGTSEQDLRLPVSEYVLHIEREKLAFDTDPFEVTKSKTVAIKVERVGRRVRAMMDKTLLGHKEEPRTTPSPEQPGTQSSQVSGTDPERAALDWLFSIGAKVQVRDRDSFIQVQSKDAILSSKRPVVAIDLDGLAVSDADLDQLSPFPEITQLRVDGKGISDAGMVRIAEFPELRTLALNRTLVTDRGLETLLMSRWLNYLELSGDQLTAECLKTIVQLPHLIGISLHGIPVTDASLVDLQKLPHLTHLLLDRTQVTDAGIVELQKLPELTKLYISQTQLTDACSENIRSVSGLETLYLESTAVSDRVVGALSALTSLKELSLRQTKITDEAIPHLSRIRSLRSLNATSTALTAEGVKRLVAALPQCGIYTDHGSFPPRNLDERASRTVALSEREAAQWAIDHEGIVELEVEGNNEPRPIKTGEPLPNQPFTVRGLSLGERSRVTDVELKQLLSGRSKLKTLVIGHAAEITDAGLALMAEHPQLEMLILSPMTKFSDQSVALIAGIKSLKSLSLFDRSLTSRHFQQLLQLSNLEVLSYQGAAASQDFAGLSKRLPKLTFLALLGENLNEAVGRQLAEHAPLRGLTVDGATVETLIGLAKLTQLKSLTIVAGKPIDMADWLRLKSLQQLETLEVLADLSDETSKALRQELPNCKITVTRSQ